MAFGVTPRSPAIVSALQRPLRRSSSRISMRVERPAINQAPFRSLAGTLAQPLQAKSIYYRLSLTNPGVPVNLVSGGERRDADDQAGEPRHRAHDRAGAPHPAGQVRAAEQDALHRQAPQRAGDAEPGRPAAEP